MSSVSTFRIEVSGRYHEENAPGQNLLNTARQLGITGLSDCRLARLYFVQGDLSAEQTERLSRELLADPVTETVSVLPADEASLPESQAAHMIEVTLLPGVTDPAADNLVRAAHLLGITSLERAATGQRYLLNGSLSEKDLYRLAGEVFSNPVIQRFAVDRPISAPFVPYQRADDTVDIIHICEADDMELLAISTVRRLALNLQEMQAIRAYFQQEGRNPTDAELEMLAQTWSEHCVHKTFKARIDYTGPEGRQTIDGILNTCIRAATEKVNKGWVRSAFVDNAGIIAFDDRFDLAFKVETHNHPSALEPFGGANTGVGGVVRDVLGVSARPIANTDVLCFGPPDLPESALPEGVLHPRRIAEGVIRGIEDYGNKMGIPTVNGSIHYHRGYTSNPLVFCGCLGLLPRGTHPNKAQPGDLIIVIGGRTGRDGLRGATFSSMEMDTTTSEIAGSSVQIGNPIMEKQVLEVVLRARDEKLYSAITDCGAGGLSSAVGEMGSQLGAWVQLAQVPLKYPGLRPWEIWLSEAQERMVLAVPPDQWPRLQMICAGQDVEAVCIGEFENSGRLRLFYGGKVVGDLSMEFLHDGIPQRQLQAVWLPPRIPSDNPKPLRNPAELLLKLLAHPDIRSKEAVIRRYDHEVQGGTTVKPLVGAANHGPGDATVIVPLDAVISSPEVSEQSERRRGVAIANGICPAYSELDPYAMAWAAIDEAVRNLVAVGADPDQVAILDNFCWGNTSLPDRLGSLVRCAQGCYDAVLTYGTPFISGKDSLNNEYADADGTRHAIPGTLLISAVGIVPDVRKTVTMDLKQPGNLLCVIGTTRDEMGGSHYNLVNGIAGGTVPQPNTDALNTMRALYRAIQAGLVQSCHDVSEGGIAVALAEMCIAGRLGAEVQPRSFDDDKLLFSESLTRFIVEVEPEDAHKLESVFSDVPFEKVGIVKERPFLEIGRGSSPISLSISDLERAWRGDNAVAAPQAAGAQPLTPAKTARKPSTRIGSPRVLILHANGTNRDREAALACQLAGGDPEIVHVNRLLSGERNLLDYHMLVLPGGFSYGDDLGAGTLWALDVSHRLGKGVQKFIADGRPVLGICNGFQTLVKSGLLPGDGSGNNSRRTMTLTFNMSGHFECRWVYLQPNPHSPCLFTEGLDEPIYCPVAHGEGQLATADNDTLSALWSAGLAALTYVDEKGSPGGYPLNPNGSVFGIAGLCNPAGNVFGLMPHPEDHVFAWHHPRWHRGEAGMDGLRLFRNGMKYA